MIYSKYKTARNPIAVYKFLLFLIPKRRLLFL